MILFSVSFQRQSENQQFRDELRFGPARRFPVLILAVLVTVGCGGPAGPKALPTVAVKGTVTVGDRPVKGGTIYFSPAAGSKAKLASGKIGTDGKFALTSYNAGDGAAEGDYIVWVDPAVSPAGEKTNPEARKIGTDEIPAAYSGVETSPLRESIAIKAGPKTLAIKLETE